MKADEIRSWRDFHPVFRHIDSISNRQEGTALKPLSPVEMGQEQ